MHLWLYINRIMNVPYCVKEKAKGLIELFGEHFIKIGSYDQYDVFQFVLPSDICTGFPFIYLYNPQEDKTQEITGFEALDIIICINDKR